MSTPTAFELFSPSERVSTKRGTISGTIGEQLSSGRVKGGKGKKGVGNAHSIGKRQLGALKDYGDRRSSGAPNFAGSSSSLIEKLILVHSPGWQETPTTKNSSNVCSPIVDSAAENKAVLK